MPNRYVVSVGTGNSSGSTVDLVSVTAGSCGLTLRRLELSFSPTTLSSSNVQASFSLTRGSVTGGSALTVNPVQESNPVSALATAKFGATTSGTTLLNWYVSGAYEVDFEGSNGVTAVSGDALTLSFSAPGTNSIAANLYFEE